MQKSDYETSGNYDRESSRFEYDIFFDLCRDFFNLFLLDRIPEGILPLIRLRAHYKHEDQLFNAIKFSQQYVGRVANPEDVLKFINVSGVKRKPTLFNKDLDEDVQHDVSKKIEKLIWIYSNGLFEVKNCLKISLIFYLFSVNMMIQLSSSRFHSLI